ncbi:fumarylacetoacetate hydrolase family protein [Curvibacter sp. RS43]|uniref:fumarylacetoacetate hydrolase family protein n=1 Tax=Curvibacter microcysteis TaxID=3026419 RepID=UPI00235E14FD|nr:fumarylacetoacetate hydrolase family protein [Curvibacter sp. RS43]MDD0812841.1 fumarylacetoacetate hydrolase family protein [Curvibacter sp. RS43]
MNQVSWALACHSVAGCPPFPTIVIEDKVIALQALQVAAAASDRFLVGIESTQGVLQHWDHNQAVIDDLVKLLAAGALPTLHEHSVPLASLRTHAPIPMPRQIFCTGANYRSHVLQLAFDQPDSLGAGGTPEERRAISAQKMDERAKNGLPYAFLKLPSAVVGPNDPIILPRDVAKPDWELELVVVIGKLARHVSREQALAHVAGYTVGNDISARDRLYRHDLRTIGTDWMSCKSSPSFLPLGPHIVPAAQVPSPQSLQIQLHLNGQLMQDASTSEMIFDIARQIEYLSSRVTLWPGDLILTGSPAGNGTHYKRFLQPGDEVVGRIAGIGEIRNRCIAEEFA